MNASHGDTYTPIATPPANARSTNPIATAITSITTWRLAHSEYANCSARYRIATPVNARPSHSAITAAMTPSTIANRIAVAYLDIAARERTVAFLGV